MQTADRLKKIPPYLFVELRKKISRAKAEGVDVISLAIGDPVEPTPGPIIDELCLRARDPENHRYPTDEERGMLVFRQEVAQWYSVRYGVSLHHGNEILGLIGSKEGCHHFILACINPGDVVLMTDPGYPAYRASILMGGGEPYSMPILAENGYLPIFEDIALQVLRKARAMFLNYPNNPTGACADMAFFDRVVKFAKAHDIAVCYDNPYSEIVFDGQKRLSFLMAEGAKEVGVELNSLSKPYNMTGWRIAYAVGNAEALSALNLVKENTDSGILRAIQFAGVKALREQDTFVQQMNAIYQRRRDLVVDTLNGLGWNIEKPRATFYVWAPVPDGYANSGSFASELLDKSGVVVTPGRGYGEAGEGYFRISLTYPDERLREAMQRIADALR